MQTWNHALEMLFLCLLHWASAAGILQSHLRMMTSLRTLLQRSFLLMWITHKKEIGFEWKLRDVDTLLALITSLWQMSMWNSQRSEKQIYNSHLIIQWSLLKGSGMPLVPLSNLNNLCCAMLQHMYYWSRHATWPLLFGHLLHTICLVRNASVDAPLHPLKFRKRRCSWAFNVAHWG